jgi:hypothetical protein
MAVMDATVVDMLYAEAQQKAAANPPGRVLATVVLAVFTALGWTCGVMWTGLWFSGMAFAYGVRKGSRVPAKPAVPPSQ